MNAREFFRAASDFTIFEVNTNGQWFDHLTRTEMLYALNKASMFEETFAVNFWQVALGDEETVYVSLVETHDRSDIGFELANILCEMHKYDSLKVC